MDCITEQSRQQGGLKLDQYLINLQAVMEDSSDGSIHVLFGDV